MNAKRKKLIITISIILGPVLAVMTCLELGLVDLETLGRWDVAISIGAMLTVFIYLFRDKK